MKIYGILNRQKQPICKTTTEGISCCRGDGGGGGGGGGSGGGGGDSSSSNHSNVPKTDGTMTALSVA